MATIIPDSELIINPDGSIYHLQLRPEQLAETIITVGDPDRVSDVSKHLDSIEHRVQHREFVTHTGMLGVKRVSVISTGIGTDNIDIVFNELDALVNIDFKTRMVKADLTSLQIIRMGTSGAVNENIPLDSILISAGAIGIDGLMTFYKQKEDIEETLLAEAFRNHIHAVLPTVQPYAIMANSSLLEQFEKMGNKGITLTANGFYAPQGRRLRSINQADNFLDFIHSFRHINHRITNLEMETAGIYGLGKHLGHRCLSINAIVAHRWLKAFSPNPQQVVEKMIKDALEILAK
jgi:uridine phosphorylase